MPESLEGLETDRERLKREIGETGDMRPGFLLGRYRKCRKPTCHCARADSKGHGPCWSLTHVVKGRTVTRVIPEGSAVERTREQIEAYRRFRQITNELIALNERICDLRLKKEGETASKKNGARRRSGGRSRTRGRRASGT